MLNIKSESDRFIFKVLNNNTLQMVIQRCYFKHSFIGAYRLKN